MLVFNGFPNSERALDFAEAVGENFDRTWVITNRPEMATWIARFPFKCTGTIVLIGRRDDFADEDEIIELVAQFGGSFAGT